MKVFEAVGNCPYRRADSRTRFVIADRPQTIVWAFTLSSRTSIWRFMAICPSVESLFSITPLPGAAICLCRSRLISKYPFCRAAEHLHTHGLRLRVATPPSLPERQALARAAPKQPVRSRTFVVSQNYLLVL